MFSRAISAVAERKDEFQRTAKAARANFRADGRLVTSVFVAADIQRSRPPSAGRKCVTASPSINTWSRLAADMG